MPWNASMSRPASVLHTKTPAARVDAPSAIVANRAACWLWRIHLVAATTTTNDTAPYTTAVDTAVIRAVANSASPPCRRWRVLQYRLTSTETAASTIDAMAMTRTASSQPRNRSVSALAVIVG